MDPYKRQKTSSDQAGFKDIPQASDEHINDSEEERFNAFMRRDAINKVLE